jgi:hypothetical protein
MIALLLSNVKECGSFARGFDSQSANAVTINQHLVLLWRAHMAHYRDIHQRLRRGQFHSEMIPESLVVGSSINSTFTTLTATIWKHGALELHGLAERKHF